MLCEPESEVVEKLASHAAHGLLVPREIRYLTQLASDHIRMSLDSETTWNGYLNDKQPATENRKRYLRVNSIVLPKLDDVDQMELLSKQTEQHLDSNPEVR